VTNPDHGPQASLIVQGRDRPGIVAAVTAVLARYMQILSGLFIAEVGVPIINIHHSFLPASTARPPSPRAR
jgi:formyltetrahydrofolate hydrolase